MQSTIRTRLGFAFVGALVLLGTIVYLTYHSTDRLVRLSPEAGDAATSAFVAITALSLLGLVALGSLFVVIGRYTRERQEALAQLSAERTLSETQYRTVVEQV